jgi:hypothetical protein
MLVSSQSKFVASHPKKLVTRLRGRRSAGSSRARRPLLEPLEDRLCLASLQFGGKFGEQTLLDAVYGGKKPDPPNFLAVVGTTQSREFPHSDGGNSSNVTLKTGPSKLVQAGVNLDLLLQGDLTHFGSFDVNLGLADTGGKFGATIPVTIVSSSPSEHRGDPVEIKIEFDSNAETRGNELDFASADYKVNYKYYGITNTLIQRGDFGFPSVHETASFHAHIGDVFGLTLSEQLSGIAHAPGIYDSQSSIESTLDVGIRNDFKPTLLQWHPDNRTKWRDSPDLAGGVDFSYSMAKSDLPPNAKVVLYWASGNKRLSGPINTGPNNTPRPLKPGGEAKVHVPAAQLGTPPPGTTDLLLVAEPDVGDGFLTLDASSILSPVGTSNGTRVKPLSVMISPTIPGEIDATFRPAGGALSLAQAAKLLGVDHFNWLQTITQKPAQWAIWRIAANDPPVILAQDRKDLSGDDNIVPPLIDPNNVPGSDIDFYYNGKHHIIKPDGAYDSFPFYFNEPLQSDAVPLSAIQDTSTLFFNDAARFGEKNSLVTPFGRGQYVGFSTELVGVSSIVSPVHFPSTPTEFTWRTNATFSAGGGVLGYDYTRTFDDAGKLPALTSGGVYNLQIGFPSFVEVTSNPTAQTVAVGDTVSFVAAAAGAPTPTAQWQVSTDGGNSFANVAGATSTTLSFTASESQNGNEYRTVFTNSSGSAITAAATLTVNTKPRGLVISNAGVFPHFNLALPPGATSHFGAQILTLSTGNIIVTDWDGGGAVYLFNGKTGALISALKGATTAVALTNGNFVATGPSSATWGSGTTGVSGSVSAANSLVATGPLGGGVYVIPLANGNYVVDLSGWNGGMGAVAWGNGTTGTAGTVSADNSLVGSTSGDWVGGNGSSGGLTALPNGNYVVVSPFWNNNEGAVTWGSGTMGVTGTISATNSLLEEGTGGVPPTVTILSNGNYVVANDQWNSGAGVVNWGSGTAGVSGVVSAANSLVGNAADVTLGNQVTALANGNYVASGWGVATWASGTTGITGTESADNSLVGGGSAPAKVTALTNGNYVVDFTGWSSDTGSTGAVVWANGNTGITGTFSADMGLVGSNYYDQVGGAGVMPLANGNYVVASPGWNNGIGAVTWGNGTTGLVGVVSLTNSLVGSTADSAPGVGGDEVGGGGVTALTNGNYVVDSPYWNGRAGAVTWGNGTTGTVGTVSSANSVVGSSSYDDVGGGNGSGSARYVTALTNGNYVVSSPVWNNYVGAVTWGNGATGTAGTVSEANSLVGSTPAVRQSEGDQVGSGGVTALPSGNYVVLSDKWNKYASAATWGDGTTGIAGTISPANSLTGSKYYNDYSSVYVLPNGNYFAGPTWVDGATGATLDGQNIPNPQNSLGAGGYVLAGTSVKSILSGNSFVYNAGAVFGTVVISVGVTDPNQLRYALGQGQAITITPGFLTRTLDAGTDVTLQANDDITVRSPINEAPIGNAGSLMLQTGRSIILGASINTAGGNLSLIANDSAADGVINSLRDPGNAAITMAPGVTLNTGPGTLSVDLKSGTDKTNHGVGVVTLLGISASAVAFSSTSSLGISLNGTQPGDGIAAGTFTQVDVAGSINLGGATLKVTSRTAASAGTTFTIVESSAGVSGTFAGLSEGATIVASDGSKFRISYHGNGGKAVVLTAL